MADAEEMAGLAAPPSEVNAAAAAGTPARSDGM